MQRNTLLRNSRASTSDLLTWPELSPQESSTAVSLSGHRSRQPSDKIGEVLRGGKLTDEEADSLIKKKPCSGYKMKEMSGSDIFSANAKDTSSPTNFANSKNRTSIRTYQRAKNGISQISFNTEENISPKKPTSIPEVAKQRELSGTLHQPDTKNKKQISSAKTKELSGNDIFGPAPEILPRPIAAAHTSQSKESKDMRGPVPRNACTSVKVSKLAAGQSNILFGEESIQKTSKKIHDQKYAELSGNNIFKGDIPPASAEKSLSRAKLREITGSNIFTDGKTETRNFIRGARRTPGGGSSIALV